MVYERPVSRSAGFHRNTNGTKRNHPVTSLCDNHKNFYERTPFLFTSCRNGSKKPSRAIRDCTLQLHFYFSFLFAFYRIRYTTIARLCCKFKNCRKKYRIYSSQNMFLRAIICTNTFMNVQHRFNT